jgi:hypothetical protein
VRDERLAERGERDREQARQARGETRDDRAARAREKLNERPDASGGRTKPAAAGSAKAKTQPARADRGKRDVKLPGAGTQAGVTERVKQRSGAVQQAKATGQPGATKLAPAQQKRASGNAGYARKRDGQGIAASTGNFKQVRTEADRGSRSRIAHGGAGQRATPASFNRAASGERAISQHRSGGGGGGHGIASDRNRGVVASRDGARGRASRGSGGGLRNR